MRRIIYTFYLLTVGSVKLCETVHYIRTEVAIAVTLLRRQATFLNTVVAFGRRRDKIYHYKTTRTLRKRAHLQIYSVSPLVSDDLTRVHQ